VLAHSATADGVTVLALHNLDGKKVTAAPVLTGLAEVEFHDVLNPTSDPVTTDKDGRISVALEGYGCRWLRCQPA
jgi:hypothetical protein